MLTRSCNTFCDVSLYPAPLSCPAHVTRRPEVIPFQSALSRHPQQRPTRDVSTAAAALSTKPGPIVTLVQQQLKDVAVGLEPKSQFLISYGVGCVLVPLLGGWLAITLIHVAARRARAWCDANPDDTAVTELFGMLPPALEYPSVVTVMIMVAVRVLRNAAWMVDTYVHRFTPKLNRAVDALVEIFCGYLVPIDQTLIKLYSIVGVVFLTVAFIKAKTVVLEFVLVKAQQESLQSSGRKGSVGTVEDFERLLVPLDALASWLASLTGGLICAQILGVSLAPLLAVGGASGIIIGLATQQLLTNAFMGLSLFFTRPFVAGDSVTCQGGGVMLTGVVERVTPMRTYIRTEDDIIVTVPNKTVADMVVYNRSTSIKRSRLAAANRKTDPLKLRIKVPHTASAKLGEVQAAVTSVLSTALMRSRSPASPTAAAAAGGGSSSGSKVAAGSVELGQSSSGGSWSSVDLGVDAPLVQPGSIEVQLSKFTDAGIELLVKANMRDEITSPAAQDMLLELSSEVRAAGAVLVNL